jgi:hypothetical protein
MPSDNETEIIEEPKPKKKVDGRSRTSRANLEKAHKTRYQQMRKKRIKEAEQILEDAEDTEESDSEILVIRNKRGRGKNKVRFEEKEPEPEPKESEYLMLKREMDELKKMLSESKQKGEAKTTIVNVHNTPPPVKKGDDNLKKQILRF